MKNEKAFVAVTESYAIISRFTPGVTNYDFLLSYVTEFPELSQYSTSCFWMSGGYAARMKRAGLAPHLVAPGQKWLSTIDQSLLGRKVVTDSTVKFKNLDLPENSKIFVKPAEAKIDSLKAAIYTFKEVIEILEKESIPQETLLQWTEDIIPLNYEHRFFVANKKVYTGSPYLIDGEVYTSKMISPVYNEAFEAAESFLQELGDNQPPAFTLDVALRDDTKDWVIVEANPAWSSGPYGADPSKILEVLEVACNAGNLEENKKWLWVPAKYLVERAKESPMMKIVEDIESASAIFKLSEN